MLLSLYWGCIPLSPREKPSCLAQRVVPWFLLSPRIAPIHHGLEKAGYPFVGDNHGGATVRGHRMVKDTGDLDENDILTLYAAGQAGKRISILDAEIRLDRSVADDGHSQLHLLP